MLVVVALNLFVKLAIPAAVEGGRIPRLGLLCQANCVLHFSTLDASWKSIAPLLTARIVLHGGILRSLGPEIARFAHATLKSAEVQGHMVMKKMRANAVCILRADLDTAEKISNYYRAVQQGEKESLGTCAVCLDEMQKEWISPVTLACSRIYVPLWMHGSLIAATEFLPRVWIKAARGCAFSFGFLSAGPSAWMRK
ncbi:hypothetical protein COCNU_08G004670 [Cocos nucifera]|uniref:Uncharacterized protein n=1 Tax=Cocos nucifera TaxID=13894 RepID=A0A8K0N620_COCNU|nr:hypothetical protein COCNU_08G004670 [Cocos nucifera]